jgi:8-oxo-dGTP pyrophosphatase MutT (NUDIX family)
MNYTKKYIYNTSAHTSNASNLHCKYKQPMRTFERHSWNKSMCNNCGKRGHHYNKCTAPTTSNGILLYRQNANNALEYMMICRKNSFGFIDFIKSNYSEANFNLYKFKLIIDEMTNSEKQSIISAPNFSKLWSDHWNIPYDSNMANHINSTNKLCVNFNNMKRGFKTKCGNMFVLDDFIKKSQTSWEVPEWEFPKGRRMRGESNIECAIREFEEESGIPSKHINIIRNIRPFDEIFVGSNLTTYKNTYFLAQLENFKNDISLDNFQTSEVSNLKWKTFEECMDSIRPYNVEKKQMLINVNTLLLKHKPHIF